MLNLSWEEKEEGAAAHFLMLVDKASSCTGAEGGKVFY